MKSLIFGAEDATPSNSATNYNNITCTYNSTWSTTEANRSQVVPCAMDITNLYVEVTTAPGAGKSYTFAVMKNGAATALEVAISDANVSGTYNATSVSFAAGDTISMRSIPSGTPGNVAREYWNMEVTTTAGAPLIGGSNTAYSAATTLYGPPMGGHNQSSQGTSTLFVVVVPTSGTISKLYTKLNGDPGSGKSYAVTLRLNNADTALTCTIADTNTTASDTTHSVTVAAGDLISVKGVPSGTPTTRQLTTGMLFTPDVDGESFFGFASNQDYSDDNFEQVNGLGNYAYSATEANRYMILGAVTLKKMYVGFSAAPGAGDSRGAILRKNTVDTALTVTVSETDVIGSTTADVSFAQGDKITMQLHKAGTPSISSPRTGVLMYFAPATGATIRHLGLLGVGV